MERTAAAQFIQRRRGRYMAQTLEAFENDIEPFVTGGHATQVADFKALVRARIQSLADDACDIVALGDDTRNGVAIELRDRVSPHGQ